MPSEPTYHFSAEKNAILKVERGVGFDDIIYCIENGYVLDIIKNKSKKYAHQQMYIVEINSYAFVVPCVRKSGEVFLKTIYPSRVMTEKYLKIRR
jgi:hypothetical protein